jgi:hypothetical protein
MRYVIRGRLREPCRLSPEEYFTLAVREWELVLTWIARGKALDYGRLGTPGGGTIVVEAASDAEARALARTSPFVPYAEMTISRLDADAVGPERAPGSGRALAVVR